MALATGQLDKFSTAKRIYLLPAVFFFKSPAKSIDQVWNNQLIGIYPYGPFCSVGLALWHESQLSTKWAASIRIFGHQNLLEVILYVVAKLQCPISSCNPFMIDVRTFSPGMNRSPLAVRRYKSSSSGWKFLARILTARTTFDDALSMVPLDSYSATEFISGSSSFIKTNLSLSTGRERQSAFAFRGPGRYTTSNSYSLNMLIYVAILPCGSLLLMKYFKASWYVNNLNFWHKR